VGVAAKPRQGAGVFPSPIHMGNFSKLVPRNTNCTFYTNCISIKLLKKIKKNEVVKKVCQRATHDRIAFRLKKKNGKKKKKNEPKPSSVRYMGVNSSTVQHLSLYSFFHMYIYTSTSKPSPKSNCLQCTCITFIFRKKMFF